MVEITPNYRDYSEAEIKEHCNRHHTGRKTKRTASCWRKRIIYPAHRLWHWAFDVSKRRSDYMDQDIKKAPEQRREIRRLDKITN